MATSHRQSFKESGSDEARDNEEDPEVCSNCATDGKLQPASYFCYNCGVFGRYICGKCLTHHNRQTLETELETERNNVEELRHKLDDSMKQIETYLKERQTLETELETERKNVEELRHKLDDSMKQIEKYLKESPFRRNLSPAVVCKAKYEKDSKIANLQEQIEKLKTELETEKKTAKEKSPILDDRGKQIKELEKVISEKDEQLKVSGDEADFLKKRLKEEIMKRTIVERDLKEKEKIAMGLEKQENDNYTENQQLKANLKELDSVYRTLAKEKKQVEQHAKNMEGYFKDEKRKSDDEYKKLLAERDDLRDRLINLAGKKLQEQNADIRFYVPYTVAMCDSNSLEQEKNITTAVENDLKSARDSVTSFELQLNGAFVENEKHKKRITELEAANKKLEAAYKNLDKQKYHMEQQANKNLEHVQNILLEEKRKSDEEYKKILAERDDLRDSLGQEKKKRTAVENELKSARDMAQRLEKQVNEDFVLCQEHKKRITELEAANKKLEAAYKNLDKQKYHMEQQANKNLEHMQNILLEEKRKSDEEYKKLLAERDDLLDSLGQEKKTRTAVENELKSARDMAQGLEKQVNEDFVQCLEHKKRIAELEAANKKLEAAYKNLDKQKYHMEQQANNNLEHMQHILLEEKRKSDEEYKKLLAERDDLLDRLSQLTGKKFPEHNADIADLSDPYRAMKLSERFGQLYDDDWTIAFEVLTDKKLGLPVKTAIHILLGLLRECYTFCNNLMTTQMNSLQSAFLHPAQNRANFDQKKYVGGLTDKTRITSHDQQSLIELRKRVAVSPPVIEEVKQALLADLQTLDKRRKKEFDKKHIEACTPYLQKCAEFCWLMALHDPPLLMKMDVKQGEKFDTNIYTVYSQSGQTIDFLVWPPLYNGRDGGLLSKGVAEPVKVVSKKK